MKKVLKELQDYCLKVVSGLFLYVGITTDIIPLMFKIFNFCTHFPYEEQILMS